MCKEGNHIVFLSITLPAGWLIAVRLQSCLLRTNPGYHSESVVFVNSNIAELEIKYQY